MMALKAITDGTVIDIGVDARDQEIESLRSEVRRLHRAVNDADVKAARAREDADRALSALRRQLSPLYRALQAVFGELDAAGVTDASSASSPTAGETAPPNARASAVWEAWKAKLGPSCAKVIDALLLHGEMNTTQLAIAVGMSRKPIPNLIYKLNQAGLITKNGGRFSLKTL